MFNSTKDHHAPRARQGQTTDDDDGALNRPPCQAQGDAKQEVAMLPLAATYAVSNKKEQESGAMFKQTKFGKFAGIKLNLVCGIPLKLGSLVTFRPKLYP
jgi:hypothetical protein